MAGALLGRVATPRIAREAAGVIPPPVLLLTRAQGCPCQLLRAFGGVESEHVGTGSPFPLLARSAHTPGGRRARRWRGGALQRS